MTMHICLELDYFYIIYFSKLIKILYQLPTMLEYKISEQNNFIIFTVNNQLRYFINNNTYTIRRDEK